MNAIIWFDAQVNTSVAEFFYIFCIITICSSITYLEHVTLQIFIATYWKIIENFTNIILYFILVLLLIQLLQDTVNKHVIRCVITVDILKIDYSLNKYSSIISLHRNLLMNFRMLLKYKAFDLRQFFVMEKFRSEQSRIVFLLDSSSRNVRVRIMYNALYFAFYFYYFYFYYFALINGNNVSR